jgi:hypothetical protein
MTTNTTNNLTNNTEREGQGDGMVCRRKTLPGHVVVLAVANAPWLPSLMVSLCAMGGNTGVDRSSLLPVTRGGGGEG